ncbi:YdeI/OmpD-associated family protein [Candidatus Woesearchaeota archaeon]|nr:YdeI/OmpD-associated family protein [Candidatus Woesearchaeota archaeon]
MKLGKTLYVKDRKEWRAWLRKNGRKENVIWLIYYKKASGKLRIPYNDAVEEALCFGWIDSTVKSIDDERFAQRFTPRRKGSPVSEMNKERIRRLIKQKRMTAAGLAAVSLKKKRLVIAKDIVKTLKKDGKAWENFRKFPEHYRRIRIAYLESQRRHSHEMFLKALNNFVRMTSRNKKLGMVK